MGAFRLLLAVLVAVSHMGKTFAGLNPGVVAVISFLIISGFVMTSLIERNYKTTASVGRFYLDRALRLFPQFLLYFLASCAVIDWLLPGTPQAAELTLKNIITSLTMLPLGFYMFGVGSSWILPAAWSLGLELCFYLVFPFLLIFKLRGVAFVLSVGVFRLHQHRCLRLSIAARGAVYLSVRQLFVPPAGQRVARGRADHRGGQRFVCGDHDRRDYASSIQC